MEVRLAQLEVHRLAPGARSEPYRASEMLCHVLNGHGRSVIDEQEFEWGPHDSIHVQKGAWFQHENTSDSEPAHLIVAKPTPLLEHIAPHSKVSAGDDFTDSPDDYLPEHPFTGERVEVGYVAGKKWMSHLQLAAHTRLDEKEKRRREARVVLRAAEAVIERSEHRGDWKVGLIDEHLGFDNRILGMYVHQLPPASYTETHKHGEAIVYVLSGRGHSLVEGERLDWRAGDCIFVQPGMWHQHFNDDPEQVSQHIAFLTGPLRDQIARGAEHVERRPDADARPVTLGADAGAPGDWWA
jgi:gentisate 1,2-dioxygenase